MPRVWRDHGGQCGRIDRTLELKEMDDDCRRKLAGIILVDCPAMIDEIVIGGSGDTGAQFSERCIRVALKDYWAKRNCQPAEGGNVTN